MGGDLAKLHTEAGSKANQPTCGASPSVCIVHGADLHGLQTLGECLVRYFLREGIAAISAGCAAQA